MDRVVEQQQAVITVGNEPIRSGLAIPPAGEDRDVAVCATGGGQTPFVATTSALTNYNGVNVSCRGACDATITVNVTGGVGPFTYSWLFGGPNTQTWAGACGGPQIVVVTDEGQGVSCGVPINVTEPSPLGVIFFGAGTPPTCADVCNGSRTALAIGGTGTPTYSWNNGAGTGSSFNQLCAGINTLTITDANLCTFDTTFTFDLEPITPNLTFTDVTCNGVCDGTASVNPTGGTPAISVTWAPPPGGGQGTPLATGLCAGVYTVLISDDGGCDTTAQLLITEPLPLAVDAVITGIACSGACNGSIALTVTGGTQASTVVWNPVPPNGQGVLTATDLCAGQYTVTVTDANGCSFNASYDVTEPQPLQVSVSTTASTCPNCDGQAVATITGGTAPYAVNWYLGGVLVGAGESISNLCGGLYTVEVTDDNGCTVTQVVQVSDSNAETLTPVNGQTTCGNSCSGSVSVSFVCTAPPCNLVWFDAGGNVIAVNEGVVDSLCVGIYTAQVTNGSGCVSFADAEVLPSQTIIPNLSSTPVSCAGAWDGTATVGPAGGIEPYTYLWSPGGEDTPQVTGLCAGVYDVLITDSTGCDTTVQVLITEPQPLDFSATVQDVLCTGDCNGSVSVIVTGGTQPYGYAWSPNANGQGTPMITDLCPGTYTLTVTDASGCSATQDYAVNEPQPLQAVLSTTLSECGLCNGTATVAASGGTAPYFITWLSGASIIGTGDTIVDLCAGLYNAIITDANGRTTTVPAAPHTQIVFDLAWSGSRWQVRDLREA